MQKVLISSIKVEKSDKDRMKKSTLKNSHHMPVQDQLQHGEDDDDITPLQYCQTTLTCWNVGFEASNRTNQNITEDSIRSFDQAWRLEIYLHVKPRLDESTLT